MNQILKNALTNATIICGWATVFLWSQNPSLLMAQETTLEALEAPEAAAFKKQTEEQNQMQSEQQPNVLDVKMKSISGEVVDLAKYKGNVIVIVNTASKCGFTRQYKHLEKLYKSHREKGLVVLGFPCNQFGGQEPGSSEEILEFCTEKYDVSFDLFEKSDVNGEGRNPVYQSLCNLNLKPKGKGDVSWNFEKFVVGRDGVPVARFSSRVGPKDEEFVALLKTELAKDTTTPEAEK